MTLPHSLDVGIYYAELENLLKKARSRKDLQQTIVDAPFHNKAISAQLGLGIVVLLLVNKTTGMIDRVSLARTDLAKGTLDMSAKPFREIRIPLNNRDNYIAIAIRRKHHMITSDWQYLFVPALTPQQAHLNQAGGGIACSVIYPLEGPPDGGAMIFSYYEPVDRIGKTHHEFMSKYVRLCGQALKAAA
jgi:hypothetical protein